MNKILIGLVIGLCLPLIAGYLFIVSGGMPVATKGSPLPLEKFIARTALHAAMRGSELSLSPVPADRDNFLKGARVYSVNCALCHGTFQGSESSIAKGLFPKPPQLLQSDEMVTDDPVGKIYWKVKNGIRLTGMPGYADTLSETELWQVSVLLQQADKLPADVQEELRKK